MIDDKGCRREYADGSVYDESYYEHGGHGSPYHGYTQGLLHHPGFKEFARLIVKAFRPSRVLEVGCATGIIVNNLRELGVAATGIDISEYATKNAVCGDVMRASATHLPFSDDSFDVVFGCHCVEHIPPSLLDAAMAEQTRVSCRWVFHVMPIWKLGPYQWTPKERQDLLNSDITDLNLEDVVWWVNRFAEGGKLRYRPDLRLRGVTRLWRDEYNFCQVCFEKEPLPDGAHGQTTRAASLAVKRAPVAAKMTSALAEVFPRWAVGKSLRIARRLPGPVRRFGRRAITALTGKGTSPG